MNKKIITTIFSTASLVALAATGMPASATMVGLKSQTSLTVNVSTTATAKLDVTAKTSADAKINARVAALNDLETRIGQMQGVTSDEKSGLDATIQASLSSMASLKAKIDADTDNTVLKADIQSITQSYRIYVLVLPQGRIIAASDRVMTIAGLMGNLSMKLQSRITAAQNAGQNVTSITASLNDINAKTADATVQAQAAFAEVANLQPDNSDQAVFQANKQALADARAKIKLAITDLKTARKDAGTVVKALASMKVSASATASTTSPGMAH